MIKLILAICCFLVIAAMASSLWKTMASNRQTPDPAMKMGGGVITAASMQELTRKSPLIVTGQCLETRSAWIERRLVTVSTVQVSEAIKGAQSSTIAVVLPGGIDTDRRFPIAMTYPGTPSIQPQEEVLLFLRPSGEMANSYTVTRFEDGKFSIVSDDRGQKMVARDMTSMPSRSGAGPAHGKRQVTALSDFKEKIRAYIR